MRGGNCGHHGADWGGEARSPGLGGISGCARLLAWPIGVQLDDNVAAGEKVEVEVCRR